MELTQPSAGPSVSQADRITSAAISLHTYLPRHGKPIIRSNGIPEWTVLSALILSTPTRLIPVSLGTGVKVLPANRLPPLGDVVHDCHAEILARRGMVRWLLAEALRVVRGERDEGVLELRHGKFGYKPGVEVWMYVSTLPCGDASTLHTAAHQAPDMAALKSSIGTELPAGALGQVVVRGRNGYENFGAIRTKPGRADSVPSICMSCSDKIANWSILGLQGALLDEVFEPVWVDHLVVGGVEEVAPEGWRVDEGVGWREMIRRQVERALWGRLSSLENRLPAPCHLHRPQIHLTSIDFPFSKPAILLTSPSEPTPSVLCVSHIPLLSEIPEILFNGCRQGGIWKPPGDVLVPTKGRSRLCKLEILRACLQLREALHDVDAVRWPLPPEDLTYYALKHPPDSTYQEAKAILRGRSGPPAGSATDLSRFGRFATTVGGEGTPFRGWLASGEKYESFTAAEKRMESASRKQDSEHQPM